MPPATEGRGRGGPDVTIPTFRQDLKEEIDLIEEVARAYGYENIPATLPTERRGRWAGRTGAGFRRRGARRAARVGDDGGDYLQLGRPGPAHAHETARRGPRRAAGDAEQSEDGGPVLLRSTLLTSLLEVIAINQRHGVTDVSAFDLGVVFLPQHGENELPAQPQRLALAGRGTRWHGFWNLGKGGEQWDFFALKGTLNQVLRGVARVEPEYAPEARPMLAVSQSARLSLHGEVIGFLGQLSDAVRENWDLTDPVFIAEIDLDLVRKHAQPQASFAPLSRFPGATRDVASCSHRGVPAQQAETVIRAHTGEALESLRLLNVYEGKPLPEGVRNLAYSLAFRHADAHADG